MAVPRVLILNPYLGIGGDVATQQTFLRYHNPEQIEVVVASVPRGDAYQQLKASGWPITLIEMEFGNRERSAAPEWRLLGQRVAGVSRLIQLARQYHIDLVYTLDRGIAPFVGSIVATTRRLPHVINAQHHHFPQSNRLFRLAARRAAAIHVNSDFLKGKYINAIGNHRRIDRIHNAIPMERYDLSIDPMRVRDELGIPRTAKVVVLAGRISQFKGQHTLVQSAPEVLRSHPDTYFLLVGAVEDHTYKARLDAFVAEHGLGERVRFAGYRRDLPAVMAAASVVTMPSIEEPFGLVALEGLAMERPVVATSDGGAVDFVIPGETGLLVPPNDPSALARAIVELLNDPERAQAMGQRGRARAAAHHTGQAYAAAVTRLIYETLGRSSDLSGAGAR